MIWPQHEDRVLKVHESTLIELDFLLSCGRFESAREVVTLLLAFDERERIRAAREYAYRMARGCVASGQHKEAAEWTEKLYLLRERLRDLTP